MPRNQFQRMLFSTAGESDTQNSISKGYGTLERR